MQWGRNANSLYPPASQPGFWRNLFDYVMGARKLQGCLLSGFAGIKNV
jgi:hypothetical protein